MRTSYDSINVRGLPPGGDLYLGYDDGMWPDADEIARTFPGKTVVRVTTNPADNEGDMLDVEKGDATPNDAPGWVQRRRDAGHGGPIVYFPASWRSQIIAAFASAKMPLPALFPAAYPGPGAVLIDPSTDVGHQYASNNNYDTSVVVDYLPGIDPAPATQPANTTPAVTPSPSEESSMAVSKIINFKSDGQLDVFQVSGGNLWHKWANGGKWTNEAIPHPAGVAFVGAPEVAIIGGACWVTVEDANGHAWVFVQTADGTTWNNAELP